MLEMVETLEQRILDGFELIPSGSTGKVAAALFKYNLVALRVFSGLPEGVSEVHAPTLQLLWVVGRHVGKLPEDVKVCGVS